MTTSRWFVVIAAAAVTAAVVVGVVLLRPDEPAREQARLTGYSLVTSGGIAGVNHHVQVSADGTALFVDEHPVAGQLPQRNVDRLATLLSDPDLAKEGGSRPSGAQCADAFRYTLTVGDTKVSKEDCGDDGDTPVLDEIIGLTDREDLRPLPVGPPRFRGLDVTYRQRSPKMLATVHVDADGAAVVRRNGDPAERSRLGAGTVDALRVLYADRVTAPSDSGGCAPEQVRKYEITPKGQRTVEVSRCGQQRDYRWTARLRIIDDLVRV